METWFRTSMVNGKPKIEPVQAERVTDASIYIDGRQFKRLTSQDCYFRTFEAARHHLVSLCRSAVILAEAHLSRAENELRAVQELRQYRTIEFGPGIVHD